MQTDPRRNIEIKAKYNDLNIAREVALRLGATPQGLLEQTDTYFHAHQGRLKIREQTGRGAQLIAYERANVDAARESVFHLIQISDCAGMISALTRSLGVRGQVHKQRELLIWKNIRIHLDRVEGLGSFVEFEAVIDAEHAESQSRDDLQYLCSALNIQKSDTIGQSYSDLLGL